MKISLSRQPNQSTFRPISLAQIAIYCFVLSAVFVFFYTQLTVPELDDYNLKIKNVQRGILVELPTQREYMLKLWGMEIPREVYFNSRPIIYTFFKARGNLKEFYYRLPKEIVNPGKNMLKISSSGSYSARFKNTLAHGGHLAIMFKTNESENRFRYQEFFLRSSALACILFGACSFLTSVLRRFFSISQKKFILNFCLSCIPCFLFLFLIFEFCYFSPFRIVFLKHSYIAFCVLMVVFTQFVILLSLLLSKNRKTNNPEEDIPKPPRVQVKEEHLKPTSGRKIVTWWLSKHIFERYVMISMGFLSLTVLFLIANADLLASLSANLVYFLLIACAWMKLRKNSAEE